MTKKKGEISDVSPELFSAFILGHFLWVKFSPWGRYQPFVEYCGIIFYGAPILLLSFKNAGLYKQQMGILHIREVTAVIQGIGIGFAIIFAVYFFTREVAYSRLATAFAAMFCLLLVSVERLVIIKLVQSLHIHGRGIQKIAVFGTNFIARSFAKKLSRTQKLGYRVVGFMTMEDKTGEEVAGKLKVIGWLDNMAAVIKEYKIDTIFICLPKSDEGTILHIANVCGDNRIDFKILPGIYQFMIQDIHFEDIDGIPLIAIKRYEPSRVYPAFKWIFDICFSLLFIILLFPLGLIVAGLIKRGSKGPVFFRQERVGENERIFTMLKFRTMDADTEKYAHTPTAHSDARITGIGRYLRKLSLDELPQLINIFRGEMSFVGPRPEMLFIVEGYNDLHKKRLKVKPGLTGMWQISSDRSLQIHEDMDYDLFYLEHQGFLLDLAIILRTFFSVLKGKGAF